MIKKIIPKKIKIFLKLLVLYIYDFKRFFNHSNINQTFNIENKLKGKLTIYYHVIEKGLTMPETRLGFGQPVAIELIFLLKLYLNKNYNQKSLEFVHSFNVLVEYTNYHRLHKFDLDPKIIKGEADLIKNIETVETKSQIEITRNEYFKYKLDSFDKFSQSRYSIRNYSSEEIPLNIIEKCIQTAQKSPTSCNRQVNRIYVIKSAQLKEQVLNLQSGNRGFGHLANTIFVITADISVFQGPNDRNESYINSGMFAMSFLLALHNKEIGACPLNWSSNNTSDKKLRQLLEIPNNERIGLLISSGYLPETIKVASSPRLPVNQITKIY